ncbi:hypothetical protein [Komagataeibacter rhaeticus]|uniref:hypothetical protein n=1 Tax=Komagataeibacter rhaeticus TaxID=215221 RepID=UPI000558D01E|nr:hypothetical protein [Komagataeibacter rhaeticus]MBL7238802.1 hypothetical protein [Komagataeibacter rhaeticus]
MATNDLSVLSLLMTMILMDHPAHYVRSPGFGSPFRALAMAVNPDHRAIDHHVFHVRIIGDSLENLLENANFHPVAVA